MEFFPADVRRNPFPFYDQFRAVSPVLYLQQFDFWLLFDYDNVKCALEDHDSFSSEAVTPGASGKPFDWLIFNDPPRHTKLRALIIRAFTPRVVADLEPRIRQMSRELLNQHLHHGEMDLAADYSVQLPLMVIAAIAKRPADEAFNELQLALQDEVNVHRVVLAWRAWAMLELSGHEHAHTMLRQSVRFCLDSEQVDRDHQHPTPAVRSVLPQLLDQHRLLSGPLGDRKADDAWVDQLAQTIFTGTREQAADAVAAALAEKMDPEAVGEAISMAANLLVLHDPGRRPEHSSPQKPPGCVHGDSVGVHASDSANAWRNIARVSNPRNQAASLIVGAYHTAGQFAQVTKDRYPYTHLMDELKTDDPAALLGQAEEAIRARDQARACAVVQRYGDLNLPERPVFDLLLKYAVSEDGALHAEKYYRTVSEEFATTRPAYRWRQVTALARVTSSEFGYPAPGFDEACSLLGVT